MYVRIFGLGGEGGEGWGRRSVELVVCVCVCESRYIFGPKRPKFSCCIYVTG